MAARRDRRTVRRHARAPITSERGLALLGRASARTLSNMPVVFRRDGFRFLFYANEGSPREPVHVHALRDGIDAKF